MKTKDFLHANLKFEVMGLIEIEIEIGYFGGLIDSIDSFVNEN